MDTTSSFSFSLKIKVLEVVGSWIRSNDIECYRVPKMIFRNIECWYSGTIESKVVAEKRQDVQSSYNIHTLDGYETFFSIFSAFLANELDIKSTRCQNDPA